MGQFVLVGDGDGDRLRAVIARPPVPPVAVTSTMYSLFLPLSAGSSKSGILEVQLIRIGDLEIGSGRHRQ